MVSTPRHKSVVLGLIPACTVSTQLTWLYLLIGLDDEPIHGEAQCSSLPHWLMNQYPITQIQGECYGVCLQLYLYFPPEVPRVDRVEMSTTSMCNCSLCPGLFVSMEWNQPNHWQLILTLRETHTHTHTAQTVNFGRCVVLVLWLFYHSHIILVGK